MEHTWLFIGIALAGDGLVGLVGGLLSERWLQRQQVVLVSFAAGALLAAAFLEVLPEAVEGMGRLALTVALASFVALALVEWAFGPHHHEQTGSPPRTLPAALLSADALHNVGDGAAIAAAFLVSFDAGLSVALAVIAHEVPQEVGDYALLRRAGFGRSRALIALAAVQITAVGGAVGVVLLAQSFSSLVAAVLSVAAGTFVYIGATDLLPEVHAGGTASERRRRLLGFLLGIALIAFGVALEIPR